MHSDATTVAEYLEGLPADRRTTVTKLRRLILEHLPKGYAESIGYGMLVYAIPLSRYPDTYNGQPLGYAGLASQKRYLSLYLMCVYGDPKWRKHLTDGFKNAGKKLNMGKCCVRFQRLEDLPLDTIAESIAAMTPEKYIAHYESVKPPKSANRRASKTAKTKVAAARSKPAKKRSR